jgi:peptide/nickel transport system permease protein
MTASEAQVTAAADAALGVVPADQPRGMFARAWEVFAENKLALAGLAFIVFIFLFCFVGPQIYHTDQVHTDLQQYMCTPSSQHLLGCNDLGYDIMGRLMAGGQTSLEVGLATAVVSVLFGTIYGAIAGFSGGFVDSLMMRIVDAGLSLPSLMVIIILSVIFHPTPIVIIFIIAIFYWFGVARVVRGETLALRNREYVQAVKVIGGGPARSVLRHIVPNAIGTIIVQVTFAVADSIITLSVLGFLTLGIAPPDTDWGSMLQGGLTYIQGGNFWWLIYPPGILIILTCISFNFIGDALRDAFETRLQRR